MKKVITVLTLSSVLLVACSADKTDSAASKMKVLNEDEVAALEEKVKENGTSTNPITPQQAEEVSNKLQQQAKDSDIIQYLEVEEGDEEVDITFAYAPNATEQQRNEFFFNYSIFIKEMYPNKKINYHEQTK